MNKIAIDCVVVEVTRRCNMKPICAHCFRGMPQNSDISTTAIDNLLAQVNEIGDLNFNGGEPLLNLTAIKYIFEKIKENNIKVSYASIVTNGLLCPDDFIDLVRDIDDYIRRWFPNDGATPHVTIGISQDKYHNNADGKMFISKCKEAFSGRSIPVLPQMGGGNPMRTGRAKELPILETVCFKWPFDVAAAIDYWEPNTKLPTCMEFNPKVVQGRKHTPIVLCPLYLSATGKLYTKSLGANSEYTYMDMSPPICDLTDNVDILSAVKAYNRGRKTCKNCMKERQKQPIPVVELYNYEADNFLKTNLLVQEPAYNYSEEDRSLAKEDMQEILSLYREFDNTNLFTAFLMWTDECKEKMPSVQGKLSPYQKLRYDMLQRVWQM